ncbi:zinc ribbon domain-containing protein [Halapricum hydrolyticum]|uniref:Zinc ribbon domain-containing protein n=1 Tax=Halapricum hydrolyticum TaxID=2979991 RepID=A0AAE3IAJ6_9EURY|nr:zinc ribbon domain-containing protein [Halapricum hydrolyticum]MCU4717839.1 zinc ribbon domain-containing protein [Halapricum hydrolyticum]MCU4727003.1 zinc ribbon domain-containing protein [Halapricum hydrolyticum]
MARSRKRPWLAAVLSLLYPGIGHLYLREWFRALLWLALVFAASYVFVPADATPETLSVSAIIEASQAVPTYGMVAMLALTVLCMGDAYVLARRLNARQSRRQRATVSTGDRQGTRLPEGLDLPDELQMAGQSDGDQATEPAEVAAPRRCPSCGRDVDDPELDFCPWCAEPFDREG